MKRSNRQVAVILNQDVEGTGFTGELLTVKPGFARNFLIPRKLADIATPALEKERQKQIAEAEARREKEVAERQKLADSLAAEPIELSLKVGPDGRVHGAVTATMVAKALKDKKAEVPTQQLSGLPLKSLGRHSVSAKLGLGVVAQLAVEVRGEQAKAPAKEKPKATA